MDRTREARRSSMAATTDGTSRRRNRTIGLRDSSEERQVELQETVRLRAVVSKRDRDRDSFNKNKRRRGSHREEGEQSTEESVGNEQDYELEDAGYSRMLSQNTASSASDQNHRRGFPPARPMRPTPPPWKTTDEVIGVTVPRKARSASAKRSHDSWVSASCGGDEQNFRHRSNSPGRQSFEAASPSSSNVSVRKKMKAIGHKTRLPKPPKSPSSTQHDIEIEIAELLYGLKTSRNQDSSQKLETNGAHGTSRDFKTSISSQSTNHQTSVLPRSTSPTSYPSMDVEKKKVEDYNCSTPAPKSPAAVSVNNEGEQPSKVETFSSESSKMSGFIDDNSTGRETKSSEAPKVDIEQDNLESNAGYGVRAYGRSASLTGDLPSCCELDVDKEGSTDKRVISAVPGANSQRVENFEIDLMAPPPMVLSPERDDLSRVNCTLETRALALDVELKTDKDIKIEDKEENLVKTEDVPEETKETMDAFKEKRDILKIDLEMPNRDNDSLTRDKLEEKDGKREPPPKATDPEVEKTVQSTSVFSSTTAAAWSSSLPPPVGYVPPPLQAVVKTDKTTGSSKALQHVNFALSPPQPKRCATHHYIARNIFLHQQFVRMNHIWPGAVNSGSLCGAKLNNVNGVPNSENMVVGQQSQKNFPRVNPNAAQVKKESAASSFPGLTTNKSSDAANSLDSMQMKQQGRHPASAGILMEQHQPLSATAATNQAGGVSTTSSASSSNKSISSSAGSLGNSSALPAVAAAMSFSYPNLGANDVPYVTIVQNNGYPFPFSTPQGATASIRGASPASAAHMVNGPFYSSQMFHPFQHPQQLPQSQALVQPSYLNTSTSIGSSSSHKQPHGAQVNANNILSSTTMQLQQSQKQSTSQSHPRKLETEGGEKAPSVASRTSYSQKNVYGQNFTIPVQPVNLSFRPSAASDSVGGNSGNFGDKQQQALKGGVELVPSQAFAISFAAFNGTSVPSNLSFSSMGQSPVIFHSLPNVAWQGYHSPGTSHTMQQKSYSMSEGKSGGNSTRQDDEKKVNSGKSSTNGPTTLVFDNSSKNLSFVLSPTNGSWPGHSVSSAAITANAPLSNNASSSQQLLQLQKQHNVQQQQPPTATRYKASTSTTSATKFANNSLVFPQTFTQCNSSNPASQSKSSGRTADSQVFQTSVITTTAPTLKNASQEQGRVLQGHSQISFGGNYKSSLSPQGQQLLNNNQPLNTIFVGSPPNGSSSKANSQGSKVGSSVNALQTQQAENSSAGTGQKSSPVCGRNVPSILTSGPSHLSELKY